MNLLSTRNRSGFDRFDAAVLALYAGVLAWAIHFYQPFVDEAQAWLIARDCSLGELLLRRLHYEGAPALWPLLLWVANRLHLPYAGINWMGGCFALAGIYILLRYAPFPRILRWLLPFTFFLQYQYAVVARPYVMFPALLFTLCIVFTQHRPRPVLFGLVAGVLANISLHAAIVAGIFALLYLYELVRPQRHWSENVRWRGVATGAGLLVALCVCSAAVAFPATDTTTAFINGKTLMKPNAILLKLVPEEKLPIGAPPLDAEFDLNASRTPNAGYSPLVFHTVMTIILSANAAFYPIAESNLLAICFVLSLCIWLWSRGCLRLVLPYLGAVLLSVNVFVFDHHTGIFLLSLVAAAWIALELTSDDAALSPQNGALHSRSRWIEQPLFAITLVVVALQVGWSMHCIRGVTRTASDPGRETAAFIAEHFAGKRVAGFGFDGMSSQAYSPQKLFFNQPDAFWLWSANVLTDRRRTEALEQHPDGVVVAGLTTGGDNIFDQWQHRVSASKSTGQLMIEFWQRNGYHITHQFCGSQFRRAGLAYTIRDTVLEPDPVANEARP